MQEQEQYYQEQNDYLGQMQEELQRTRSQNVQLNTALASNSFNQQGDNLVHYQLETSDMLNRIEHFLKGEIIEIDKEGNESWQKQKNKDLVLFNEYGVNSIMVIIGSYIDKNTSLSIYDELRIYEILADLGDQMADFMFCNYERMGLTTEFKKSRYVLTVLMILHMIESTYRRALRGKTSEDINTSRIVTQTDMMGKLPMMPMKKRFNLFKPGSW